jgi:cytochrome c
VWRRKSTKSDPVGRSFFICTLTILLLPVLFSYQASFTGNHPPAVKIIAPSDRASYKAGATIPYQISVSDPEDGDSKYDEINGKEVVMEIKRLKDNPGIKNPPGKNDPVNDPGLSFMTVSNCFNCHNFNSKSIGPSFFEISKRYPATKANIDTLSSRIKNGSSGIWVKEKMPSHPELTAEQINATVRWILKNSAVRDISYYNGLSGIIQFAPDKKGSYLLTAVYTDHGTAGEPAKHLKGFDRITLRLK